MEIVTGQVADRPWGQTLGALGLRKLTGQITLHADDGKDYCVAFERGAVVGASSPLAIDSAPRVALTNHLISSSQVAEVARRVAADPQRDEIDTLADACRFSAEQTLRLRQRVIAQRAARTFSIERGSFVIGDRVEIPTWQSAAVDVRAVVYLGIRMNLSEQRLAADLRALGTHFVLKQDAIGDLSQFGLTTSEHPILESLKRGTTLPELEVEHREIDPRTTRSVIYALVSCFACEGSLPSPAEPTLAPFEPIVPRTNTNNSHAVEGIFIKSTPRTTTTDRTPTSPIAGPRDLVARITPGITNTPWTDPPTTRPRAPTDRPLSEPRTVSASRTRTPSERPRSESPTTPGQPRARSPSIRAESTSYPVRIPTPRSTPAVSPDRPIALQAAPSIPRATTPPSQGRVATQPTMPIQPRAVTQPTMPTQPRVATQPVAASRESSAGISRTMTPTAASEYAAVPVHVPPAVSRTTSESLLTLADSTFRIADDRSAFGPEEPSGSQRVIDPMAAAAEAFQRAQSALRDDQLAVALEELLKATELNPTDIDYQAMLAWARFCDAVDKTKIADKTRKILNHAIQKSMKPELSRFYLGRVERILGRNREALKHFQDVLEAQPRNSEAASEIRMLETRMALGSGEKPGLASLFGRKKPP